MEPQTFQNNDFGKEMMQYCKFPNRDKRETSRACSATEQNPQVFLLQTKTVEKLNSQTK